MTLAVVSPGGGGEETSGMPPITSHSAHFDVTMMTGERKVLRNEARLEWQRFDGVAWTMTETRGNVSLTCSVSIVSEACM